MYIDLYELPQKCLGSQFFVQYEITEQHYRIEFVGTTARKPMLIAKSDQGEWIDFEDRNHGLAREIGKFIEGTLTKSELAYVEKKSM